MAGMLRWSVPLAYTSSPVALSFAVPVPACVTTQPIQIGKPTQWSVPTDTASRATQEPDNFLILCPDLALSICSDWLSSSQSKQRPPSRPDDGDGNNAASARRRNCHSWFARKSIILSALSLRQPLLPALPTHCPTSPSPPLCRKRANCASSSPPTLRMAASMPQLLTIPRRMPRPSPKQTARQPRPR